MLVRTSVFIEKAREFQKKNIYFCFIDYTKAFVWITTSCAKFLKKSKYQATLLAAWEIQIAWEICMQVKRQQWEPYMEQWTGSKLRKEYVKAVYCHPAYLAYVHSTSCEMLGWMKHKLKSRLWGKYQYPQIFRWYHPNGIKQRRTKEPLDESERGEWKSWLKSQHLEN